MTARSPGWDMSLPLYALGWIRVRGVRFACEAPRTGWNGTKGEKRLENQLICQNRPNFYTPVPPLPAAREGRGSLELVEIFQMRWIARRFTPVCRSRCGAGGADRGPGAGRFVRDLGPLPLCVVLLVQANRNHTSDRDLGPAAESTLSGMGRVPAAGRCG